MSGFSNYLFLAGWTVLTVLAVRRRTIEVRPTIGQANLADQIKGPDKKERRAPKPSKGEDRLHGWLLVCSAVLTAAGWTWLIGGIR